ncbi:MAG: HNH endonuclease [Rhodobacteraceae bacterium]|nr:HNH endonuclease [Stutzerimonas balearica]TNF16810.1 MAG: HNH endonuclease [Paracoccaceae bacterium]
MKGRAIIYSDLELSFVKVRADLPRRELHAEFCRVFGRSDVSLSNLNSLCKRNGWMTGRTGCFPKGNVPQNKGKKGFCAPGSEKGWFRKGERRGVAVDLYKPIGTERLSKEGYVERKIHDGMPLQSRWRAVHLINWEAENGPVPEGHVLKCLDGDKANTAPSNWACIPRSMLPKLNARWGGVKFDDAPDELKPTIMEIVKLDHAAREAKKGGR